VHSPHAERLLGARCRALEIADRQLMSETVEQDDDGPYLDKRFKRQNPTGRPIVVAE
jgi:hypothetical protein